MTKQINNGFSSFKAQNGLIFDYSDNQYPTKLFSWVSGLIEFENKTNSTFFVYLYDGSTKLTTPANQYQLNSTQYASINSSFTLEGGKGIIIEKINYRGMNIIGGELESEGRLRYIDGCTDSLLIPPVKFGDPCFNALYFPENVDQTAHTHPSMRIGMVISGKGECVLAHDEVISLEPGMIFIIHEDSIHKFRTLKDQHLNVVAYHPDSDFGPKDINHPMINRTIIEGVSASKINSIQTANGTKC